MEKEGKAVMDEGRRIKTNILSAFELYHLAANRPYTVDCCHWGFHLFPRMKEWSLDEVFLARSFVDEYWREAREFCGLHPFEEATYEYIMSVLDSNETHPPKYRRSISCGKV